MDVKYSLIGWALLGIAGLTAVACAGNECDQATNKLGQCGLNPGSGGGGGSMPSADCSGLVQCQAGCVNQATCADITQGFQGTKNAFSNCQVGCRTQNPASSH